MLPRADPKIPPFYGVWNDYKHVYIRAPRAKTVCGVLAWIIARISDVETGTVDMIRIEMVDPPRKKVMGRRQKRG